MNDIERCYAEGRTALEIYAPDNRIKYKALDEIPELQKTKIAEHYLVTDKGKVVNWKAAKYLICDYQQGYQTAYLATTTGKYKHFLVHRLVALAFCPKSLERSYVHHCNLIQDDNRAKNLLWVTTKEHSFLHKLYRSDRKEYWNMVYRIRSENREAVKANG